MKSPKSMEIPARYTGQLYCTCGIPYRDAVGPIIALIGEKTTIAMTGIFVYVKYCPAQYDAKTKMVNLRNYDSGENYGSVPVQVFIDYLLKTKDYTDDISKLKSDMENFGGSGGAEDIEIPETGAKVRINRSYRSFKTSEIVTKCDPLPIYFKNLEDWPLLYLTRGFNYIYKHFLNAIYNNGYDISESKRRAILEYRRFKAIEEGYLAHRQKLSILEDLGIPYNEQVILRPNDLLEENDDMGRSPGNEPRPRHTSPRYASPSRPRRPAPQPRRLPPDDRPRAEGSGHPYYDVAGKLRIPMGMLIVRELIERNEQAIREGLDLLYDRPVIDQIIYQTDRNSETSQNELVVDRRPDLGYANSLVVTDAVGSRGSIDNDHIAMVASTTKFRAKLKNNSVDDTIREYGEAIRQAFHIPADASFYQHIDADILPGGVIEFTKLVPMVEVAPIEQVQPRPGDVRELCISKMGRTNEEILQAYKQIIRKNFHIHAIEPLLDNILVKDNGDTLVFINRKLENPEPAQIQPNFFAQTLRMRKMGRSYNAVLRDHAGMIRGELGIPAEAEINDWVEITEEDEDVILTKRDSDIVVPVDIVYRTWLNGRFTTDVLLDEALGIREALGIPPERPLIESVQITESGEHLEIRKLPEPRSNFASNLINVNFAALENRIMAAHTNMVAQVAVNEAGRQQSAVEERVVAADSDGAFEASEDEDFEDDYENEPAR